MLLKELLVKQKTVDDSNPKYRGIKKSDGQCVRKGNIIVKTDNRFKAGKGTKYGKDFTIFCIEEFGKVSFGRKDGKVIVKVLPIEGDIFWNLYK